MATNPPSTESGLGIESNDVLVCEGFSLPLRRPLVMGVVNVTPDSFSDGGEYFSCEHAVARAEQLVADGADILDLGGESSRPGSVPVPFEEERRRVMPVLNRIVGLGVPVSVDTTKASLMREALDHGASMINDIFALDDQGAVEVIAATRAGVCLMHTQGKPKTMQNAPHYENVVSEVSGFLSERANRLLDKGVDPRRIVLDPGFGFGKTLVHNLELLQGLRNIVALGFPVLAGLSRKSLLGRITGRSDSNSRLGGSLAAALFAVHNGASIVRVHDVAETCAALQVWQAGDNFGVKTN